MAEPNLIPPEHGEYTGPGIQARCPECGVIIDAHPASRADGRWEGSCPEHGLVVADYRSYEAIRGRVL